MASLEPKLIGYHRRMGHIGVVSTSAFSRRTKAKGTKPATANATVLRKGASSRWSGVEEWSKFYSGTKR